MSTLCYACGLADAEALCPTCQCPLCARCLAEHAEAAAGTEEELDPVCEGGCQCSGGCGSRHETEAQAAERYARHKAMWAGLMAG